MGLLLDTNVLIRQERGTLDLAEKITGREEEPFFISVISASELLHGVWRASNPAIRARRQAFVENVLSQSPILNIDLTVARIQAQIWSDLRQQGQMIGLHDAWIAASALAHGLSVVTANAREFERVPGLAVEVW